MRLWSGLAWRTAAFSVLMGLLTTTGIAYFSLFRGAEAGIQATAHLLATTLLATHAEACRASAPGWTLQLPEGMTGVAFDAREEMAAPRGSVPEDGPDPSLVARLAAGEQQPSTFYFPLFARRRWGGALLMRAAEAGPCSLIEYRWPVLSVRFASLRWMLLAAVSFSSLAAALSTFAVIRPLLRRLRRLHAAAGRLGGASYAARNDETPDELGDLSRVLDTTHTRVVTDAAHIEAQKHALERFLSDVSHDLKTPIASLQLGLELAASAPSEDVPGLLVQGIEDTVYLTSLVDNLRLACQLGEGVDPLDGEPRAELGMIVQRVVRRLGLLARRKELSLDSAHPDAALWVRCNPTMLEQAVGNLLQNAVTHGNQGGHVVAVLEAVEAERFRLTVLDDGPGVPPGELERLGERLFRSSEARRRDPRGSGLGVAIVRELCRRVGLELRFTPNEPHGLKVVIEGPRATPPASAA